MEDLWCNFALCRKDQTIRGLLLAPSDSRSRCAAACCSLHSSGRPSPAVEPHGGQARSAPRALPGCMDQAGLRLEKD